MVSFSAAKQDVLPDGPERQCSQMVQKDSGGVEAQIPESPGHHRAVTARSPALAARTCAPAQLMAIRDASRPPPSHLKGNVDSGTLQLFYLKEKKKKIPNNTKNKTNNEQEFRVALLALCALWRPPRAVLVASTQCCACLPDSHLDQWTSATSSPPCTRVTCWSCCGLGDRVYLWALSAP